VKSEKTANEWPVHKIVGRRPAHMTPLRRLEGLNTFLFQHAKNVLPKRELFPVRKSVGQARKQRS